jgi:hypothetical protein
MRQSQVVLSDTDNPGGTRVLPWWYVRRCQARTKATSLQASNAVSGNRYSLDPTLKKEVLDRPSSFQQGKKAEVRKHRRTETLRTQRRLRRQTKRLAALAQSPTKALIKEFTQALAILSETVKTLTALLPQKQLLKRVGVEGHMKFVQNFVPGGQLREVGAQVSRPPNPESAAAAAKRSTTVAEHAAYVKSRAALATKARWLKLTKMAIRTENRTACSGCALESCPSAQNCPTFIRSADRLQAIPTKMAHPHIIADVSKLVPHLLEDPELGNPGAAELIFEAMDVNGYTPEDKFTLVQQFRHVAIDIAPELVQRLADAELWS